MPKMQIDEEVKDHVLQKLNAIQMSAELKSNPRREWLTEFFLQNAKTLQEGEGIKLNTKRFVAQSLSGAFSKIRADTPELKSFAVTTRKGKDGAVKVYFYRIS